MKKFWRRIFKSKERRAYNKMHCRHRKELIKLAKNDGEWDCDFLHELVITKVRHMHEYYSAGNNVWQTDKTRLPIIEQLKHVLDLQDELDNLWDGINDLSFVWKREVEIYKEIYTYIGEHLQEWWD